MNTMDIQLIQWSITPILSIIFLLLPQLIITDGLQVQNNSSANSCEENGTFTWLDSARKQWPSLPFEPYDLSSQNEFIPLVTSTKRVTPNLTNKIRPTSSFIQIDTTPSIIRLLISTSLPSSPPLMESVPPHPQPSDSGFVSSPIQLAPTPTLNLFNISSSVQSTPTFELTSNKRNPSTQSINLSSSLGQPPSVNSTSLKSTSLQSLLSSSSIVNDNVTFPLIASHTVIPDNPAYHGHQPSGSGQIYRVMSTAIPSETANSKLDGDFLTLNNGTIDSIEPLLSPAPPTTATLINFSSSSLANQPDLSEMNAINESHMSLSPSPSSSPYFPVLSGTISIIPSDSPTDSPTSEFPFPWISIDNSGNYISFNNSGNNSFSNETNNHDEDFPNHHGIPQAATSNATKCDPSGAQLSQPAPDSGFLVRSVLKRDDQTLNPNMTSNLTAIFESRLAQIFNLAYHKQLNGLVTGPDVIKKDVHVKLWNLFWDNSTNDFHLIYQIEQERQKILARDLQIVLSHVSHQEMSNILGYNVTIKAEPYVNTVKRNNSLASTLADLDWLPLAMIILSLIVFLFCTLLTLISWRRNRRLLTSSSKSSSSGPNRISESRSKSSQLVKPIKPNTKENLVNWRKVSGPGSKRSFLGSHGSGVGLNISGGCSATSGTIDSNHEFEYLSFDSPDSSLKLRTAEYRSRRPYSSFPSGLGSQSRLELAKEKVIPIGELDEIAEMSSNDSSHDQPHRIHKPSRVTYVTTKEEMIGDYENPLMRSGVDEVDCSVPQLIQVHISEQTQNIIQAIRSELKKFNPITGNVQSQSQSSTAQFKESTSTSDA